MTGYPAPSTPRERAIHAYLALSEKISNLRYAPLVPGSSTYAYLPDSNSVMSIVKILHLDHSSAVVEHATGRFKISLWCFTQPRPAQVRGYMPTPLDTATHRY